MQLREELSSSKAALSIRVELQTQTELREQAERRQYLQANTDLCAAQAQQRIETHELRQQLDQTVQLKDEAVHKLEIAQQTHHDQLLQAQMEIGRLQTLLNAQVGK